MQAIIGKKITQTQVFMTDGSRLPVTKIAVMDTPVVQIKTQEKDKYSAVQLGFGERKRASKALLGHSKKAKLEKVPAFFYEVKVHADAAPSMGDVIKVSDVLKPGDLIKVTGVSKGKGFAGGVKRYHFRGGPKTHGQSDRHRAPGSIGQGTTPGRVYKGKRMAGHMGVDRVTVKNLAVIEVSPTEVMVKGLIPGGKNTLVLLEKIGEQKQVIGLYKTESQEEKVVEEQKESTSNVAAAEEVVATTTETPVVEETAKQEAEQPAEGVKADSGESQPKADQPLAEKEEK